MNIMIEDVEMKPVEKYGCFWGVKDGVLFYCPMNKDKSADQSNFGEVEFLSQEMVDEALQMFGFDLGNIEIEHDRDTSEWLQYLHDIYEPPVMLDSTSEEDLIKRYTAAASMFSSFASTLK